MKTLASRYPGIESVERGFQRQCLADMAAVIRIGTVKGPLRIVMGKIGGKRPCNSHIAKPKLPDELLPV